MKARSKTPAPPVRRPGAREVWLRAGIWLFIAVFVLGSVGGLAFLFVR